MSKYRKKPVVVEAVQFLTGQPYPDGVVDGSWVNDDDYAASGPCIQTLEGVMRVLPLDWIITGVQGEKYPCKPDIFAATYAPADDESALTGKDPAKLAALLEACAGLEKLRDRDAEGSLRKSLMALSVAEHVCDKFRAFMETENQ